MEAGDWWLATGLAVGILLAGQVTIALAADDVVLKHDDGTMEAKQSTTGGGHAVLFERPDQGPWYLDRIELFGARYGTDQAPDEDFQVYVTDPAMESYCKIARPYGLFQKGDEKWTAIEIPSVEVPQTFYVCVVFNPTRTKGVYVGIDKNVEQTHSKNAVPGSHVEELAATADWMIRVHLSGKIKGEPLHLLSKEQREAKLRSELAESEARLLKGARSKVLAYDDGEMDNFFSYGGATAEVMAFEAPGDCPYVYAVSFYGSQYGGQHDAEAVNGDVYLLDAELKVISRTSFPYSLLTYQKAWIEVPVLPTKVTGKFYAAIHAHCERYKGIYVGYDEDCQQSHSSLGGVGRERFTSKPAPKTLDWMIRVKLADKPVYRE